MTSGLWGDDPGVTARSRRPDPLTPRPLSTSNWTIASVALLLTARRQRYTERTELYTKAAELLGSDQPQCGWPACTPWNAWLTAPSSTARSSWM